MLPDCWPLLRNRGQPPLNATVGNGCHAGSGVRHLLKAADAHMCQRALAISSGDARGQRRHI